MIEILETALIFGALSVSAGEWSGYVGGYVSDGNGNYAGGGYSSDGGDDDDL